MDFTQKRYLITDGGLDGIARTYHELFPGKVKDKVVQADLICEHIFDLLGSGPTKLAAHNSSLIDQKKTLSTIIHEPRTMSYIPIDWHSDFKSGYRWNPKTFYQSIRHGHIEGVDIKVPWELSRFQHLNILGQVYILTGDNKYAEEFASQITDWIRANPVGFGVNWSCAMDIAIRAANWLAAMEYFIDRSVLSQNFLDEFYGSVYGHGKFIRAHLERSLGLTTNHYLANIVGLFFISVYCPFFKESRQWQGFALKELSNEAEKQIYPDGCNFEASTSYHRLALELFFSAQLLGEKAGIGFPEYYKNKVKKMFEFLLYCIKPNGEIPQIGDNDNGRFLIFSKRSTLEHKYLLNLAAIYYRDSEFKISAFDFDEETFWFFDKVGKQFYDNLALRKEPIRSKEFSDAGWYIIRRNDDYCFISCGPNGQNGKGGHAHNDKLSFELILDGQDIIVDTGTYAYTPYLKERNKFRSTGYHNTIKFDDYEQNEISENDMFSLPDRIKIKNAGLKEKDDKIIFQGEVQYLGVLHKRVITLDKQSDNWLIKDSVSCKKRLNARLIFHLSPAVFFDDNCIVLRKTGEKIALIEIEGYELEKGEYDYSPEYGIKVKAESLIINIPMKKDTKTLYIYIKKVNS